jgi:hypothetical protein
LIDPATRPLAGRRIVEIDLWDGPDLDLIDHAHIAFTLRGAGEITFVEIRAGFDSGYSAAASTSLGK